MNQDELISRLRLAVHKALAWDSANREEAVRQWMPRWSTQREINNVVRIRDAESRQRKNRHLKVVDDRKKLWP